MNHWFQRNQNAIIVPDEESLASSGVGYFACTSCTDNELSNGELDRHLGFRPVVEKQQLLDDTCSTSSVSTVTIEDSTVSVLPFKPDEGSWTIYVLDKQHCTGQELQFLLIYNGSMIQTSMKTTGKEILCVVDGICGNNRDAVFHIYFCRCSRHATFKESWETHFFLHQMVHKAKLFHSGLQLLKDLEKPRSVLALTGHALGFLVDSVECNISFADAFLQLHYGKCSKELIETYDQLQGQESRIRSSGLWGA